MNRVTIALLTAHIAVAANWPSFRGPNASGLADGPAPTTWDAATGVNILWKTPIPGLAHSSPVVWGDRVFITTAISSDPKAFRHGLFGDVEPSEDLSRHTWKVYCLDRNTGKVLWERTSHEDSPKIKRHPKNSQASSTPATDGKHVIAFFGSEGLYAYDLDGKLLWNQDLGILNAGWFLDPDYEWSTASSPIIYKDLVIVQCDIQKNSFIAAFNLDTGKQVWKTPRAEISSWGTPAIYEGKDRAELVTNSTRSIHGYDPATGKEIWTFKIKNSEITATSPLVTKDLIVIANGYPPIQPIFAIRPGASGEFTLREGQESNDQIAWSKQRGGPYMPTVIAVGELLYSVSNNGVVSAYQLATGERIYQQRLSPNQGTSLSASPVYADGKIYFASEDGDVFVVRSGQDYELLATNPMGEVLMATPAISEGTIFIRGEHNVFAIREKPKP
jgi:outer membrane protein assembly factor BamB